MVRRRISQRLFQNTSVKQTIIKNSFWLLVSEVVSKVCTFLVTLWIARYLGVESYGISNFSITFAGFFVLAVDFGLVNLTFRELSKHIEERDEFFTNAIAIKVFISLCSLLIALVVTRYIGKPGIYTTLIMVYLLYAILNNICEYLRVYFRPYERMQHEALLKVGNAIVFLLSSLAFIFLYGTLQSVFRGFLVAGIVNIVVSLLYVVQKLHIKPLSLNIHFMKKILRMALPFFLSGIFIFFYTDINIVMLWFFRDAKEVGLFSVAYSIIFYVYMILNIFSVSFFKKLVDGTKKIAMFRQLLSKYLLINFSVSILVVLGVFSVWWWLVTAVYGHAYQGTIIMFKLLSFWVVIKSVSYVYGTWLTTFSKEYTRLWTQVFAAIVNVLLNIILIPLYGYVGCIISLLVTEICLMILYRIYLTKYMKIAHQDQTIDLLP